MEFLHAMMQVAGLDPFLPQNIFPACMNGYPQGLILGEGKDLQHFIAQ